VEFASSRDEEASLRSYLLPMKVSTRISRRRNGIDCRVIYPGYNIGVAKVSIVQGVFLSYENSKFLRVTVRKRYQIADH
jgi:hypothetical protein